MQRLIKHISNESLWNEKNITFYFGIDPTADGLHIGHLLPIILAIELIKKGAQAIVLIGGFTASIGDPTGKNTARNRMEETTVVNFSSGILKDLQKIFQPYSVNFVNNQDWLGNMNLQSYIEHSYGISVNRKLHLDTFQTRINENQNLAMSEFVYTDLQAIDFLYLYDKYGCNLQIGGGDQWGNIAFGVHYVEKMRAIKNIFGATTHLLTINGQKIGKTVGKPPFLNNTEDLYDFCMTLPDDIASNLYYLLVNENIENPQQLKKALIEKILYLYHNNNDEFLQIEEKKKLLKESSSDTYEQINENQLCKILFKINLTDSISEAKRQIKNGAIAVNDEKTLEDLVFEKGEKIKIVFAKKNVFFLEII